MASKTAAVPATEETAETATPAVRGVVSRPFGLKSTSAGPIPDRLNGAEIKIRLADYAQSTEDALKNMLALCVNDTVENTVKALVDTFNSAAALAVQKAIKDAIEDSPKMSVAEIQQFADAYLMEPNKRGGPRGGKTAEAKRKAEKLDTVTNAAVDVAADLDTREAAGEDVSAERALMKKLGLI